MAFMVGLPTGMRDFEFDAYVRMLRRDGISLADTPRACDARAGNRWLHVWTDCTEAEHFASRLREDSEIDRWQVYDVPDGETSVGPLGPLEVIVNRQGDGYTYGLRPTSQILIQQRHPEARLAPSVFISADTRKDFELTQAAILDQVVQILTGLNDEKIEELGGFRLYDRTGRILREAPTFVA